MEPSFPYPITFVIRFPKKWPELFDPAEPLLDLNDSNTHSRIHSNEDCWIVVTYLILKQKGFNVFISNQFKPGSICVVSSLDFGIQDRTFNTFIVGCRGDGFRPPLCNFTVVQNQANIYSETDVLIPLWPQPGIIPRDKARGSTLTTIAFKGNQVNLYAAFRSPEFCQDLKQLGIELKIYTNSETGSVQWHDYTTDDLILAARDLTEKDALVKPASKLINAWIAGVPALLGPEPAFQALRQSDLDYIEVKTPSHVLSAVQTLKSQPELYQQMVAHGWKRAEEFTLEATLQKWIHLLSGPVPEHYERWQRQSGIQKILWFSFKSFEHKLSQKAAAYHRVHGYRILSAQYT